MHRKIIIVILIAVVMIPFFWAPSTCDNVAALKHTTFIAIFGDVRQKVMGLCHENRADRAAAGTLGSDHKDGWGEEIDFTWKDNETILLTSSGEDKIKGSADDVNAMASCNGPYFRGD